MLQKTKIIATLGPSCNSYKTLKEMVLNGLNVVRLNLSHSTQSEHQKYVNLAKEVRKDMGVSLPIMLDTRGPEVRVDVFEKGSVKLKKGDNFTFTAKKVLGNERIATINTPQVFSGLKVGGKILACNGLLTFKIIEKHEEKVVCKVMNNGELADHKSLFLPNVELNIPYLNKADKKDIIWGIQNEVEYIAASFVSKKEDVIELKKFIKENGGTCDIIAKIESNQGVKNLDEILEHCAGIMVARGDLGVEVPMQRLPKIQKDIIFKTRLAGKISITATEMLESMIKNLRPTRAETSDVANAVFDGTSAVMLSGETAMGKHPVEVIKTMSSIVRQTEKSIDYTSRINSTPFKIKTIPDVVSYTSVLTSASANAKTIAVTSNSGRSPKLISRFMPACPIMALTDTFDTFNKLGLVWGIQPVLTKLPEQQLNEVIKLSNKQALNCKLAKAGDVIVVTSASRTNVMATDFVKVHIVN